MLRNRARVSRSNCRDEMHAPEVEPLNVLGRDANRAGLCVLSELRRLLSSNVSPRNTLSRVTASTLWPSQSRACLQRLCQDPANGTRDSFRVSAAEVSYEKRLALIAVPWEAQCRSQNFWPRSRTLALVARSLICGNRQFRCGAVSAAV